MTSKQTEIIGSLITIGDELLLGDVLNGNSQYIAFQLRAGGFRLGGMVTVGDREEEIVDTLARWLKTSRFLIVTGGLGPTEDDRTSPAAAKALGLPLVPHHEYREWLKKRLAEHGRSWSEEVDKMTWLPQGSIKLGKGMAGFFVEHNGIPCYFLPGVPHEMKTLMESLVMPDLDRRFPRRPVYVKQILRVQELMESEIGRRLKGLSAQEIGAEIGYLPQTGENWVTLFVTAASEHEARERLQRAEREISSRLGAEHISGYNDDCLEKVVGSLLRHKGWKLALAESCTGGLLSQRITAVPGASDYFDRGFITYSNQAKTDLLKVPESLLESHGAVSAPVAVAMAEGARIQAKVEVALAITGIAGPSGGSPEKPVGTVFMACSTADRTLHGQHLFSGEREQIQQRAAQAALVLLWRTLWK